MYSENWLNGKIIEGTFGVIQYRTSTKSVNSE